MTRTLKLFLLFLLNISLCSSHSPQIVFQGKSPVKKIAIIGGGASGTSTAFWLSNTIGQSIPIDITVYEKNNYIGGRSTTIPIKDDPSLGYIELGASIFVEANYNMMNASKKFGFPLKRLTAATKLGIWDGESFLFEESGNQYWDVLKLFWRFGTAPLKFSSHKDKILGKFLKVYQDDLPSFTTLDDIIDYLDLNELVNQTATDYFATKYGDQFVHEMIQTGSRGNYNQDVDYLHAFGALVSMAAGSGAWSLEDGNYRIFEKFLEKSTNTKLYLNTKVTSIDFDIHRDKKYTIYTHPSSSSTVDQKEKEEGQDFDMIVLASPLHLSDIDTSCLKLHKHHFERDYHTVHVTMIAGYPNPSYFGRNEDNVPTAIITTGEPLVNHFKNKQPPFTTFTRHKTLDNGEGVYKMFSQKKLTDQDLSSLFYNTSWVYRHEWQAFPKLYPSGNHDANIKDWPSIILHGFHRDKVNRNEKDSDDHDDNDYLSNGGIIYANAFENFISTMETQTIIGKNIAKVIYDHWCYDNDNENLCTPFGDGWGNF
ncbi:Prenylcysteine lyase-domain-containing protein [Cunninghamella echinulata]|nr:Prenylcysteine lyase-domain-containing protein [Cunninghamella echinulata]